MPIEWAPFSPKQLSFFDDSTARINIADGPIRSGKTVICLVRWGEFVKTGPQGDLMILGTTERTIKRNVIGPLTDIFGARYVRHIEGKGELYLFGRPIYLVGANNAGAESRVRGATLAGAYGNEITLWPEVVFKQLIGRMSVRGAQFFGDTNPDSPEHWLHRDYLANEALLKSGILKRWQFSLDDNLALDPEYRKSLEALYTGLWYKRMIQGQWVLAEGVVYDTFDAGVHCINWRQFKELTGLDRIPATWPVVRSIDFGYNHPFVCQWWAISPAGDWFRYREIYMSNRLVEDHARQIVDLSRGERIVATYADHDAEDRATLEKHGVSTQAANKAVSPGLQLVHRFITPGENGRPKLYFMKDALVEVDHRLREANRPTCTEEEVPRYMWDAKRDAPVKENDDGCDAMRYAVYSHVGEREENEEDAIAALRRLRIHG